MSSFYLRTFALLLLLAPTAAYPNSLTERGRQAVARSATFFRIHLLASDAEWEQIHQAIGEAEHAVEPPTTVEGFWRRKLEILLHPAASLNLRRSFQNVRRLMALSKDFESPWLRELLASSATMFGITHGSEFVSGAVLGTSYLLSGDVAMATAWYGLALPGLYDVGCWVGQGALILRPTRIAFNESRKFTIAAVGRSLETFGVNRVLAALLEKQSAQDRIREALNQRRGQTSLDFEIPDEELRTLIVKDSNGQMVLSLEMEEQPDGTLLATHLLANKAALASASRGDLREILRPLGWNIWGAVKQVRSLLKRRTLLEWVNWAARWGKLPPSGRADLIEHEKTFVSGVQLGQDSVEVEFRRGAVFAKPNYRRRESACPGRLVEVSAERIPF